MTLVQLSRTEAIESALITLQSDQDFWHALSSQTRESLTSSPSPSSSSSHENTIPASVLVSTISAWNKQCDSSSTLNLDSVLRGSSASVPSAEPSKEKRTFLDPAKRAVLEAALANAEYAEMTRDIGLKSADGSAELSAAAQLRLSTQMAPGIEVAAAVGTLYSIGWYIGHSMAGTMGGADLKPGLPSWMAQAPYIFGLFGAILGVFLEGVLIVFRANRLSPSTKPPRQPQRVRTNNSQRPTGNKFKTE